MGPADGPQVLLLAAYPVSGQRWVYEYSPAPGQVARLVVMPGPGAPAPDDPAYAAIVLRLVHQSP